MKYDSTNYKILRNLISKSRRFNLPPQIDYVIIYTFLYKYCSDSLKDHFLMAIQDKEITLDEAYRDGYYRELLREDALHLFGYHFENPEAFIDEVINKNYSDRFFLTDFFRVFPDNITFDEKSKDREYFKLLFKTIREEISVKDFEFDNEMNLAIKEIIFSISKLDLFDNAFEFRRVFDVISYSRLMNVESNPEYVSQILSTLISCEKTSIKSAYDPFMKDGTSLMKLSDLCETGVTYYGKEEDKLTYLYTIARFFINIFYLDHVVFKNEDATQSIDIEGASFDAILSEIPVSIKNYHSANKNQSFEIAKRSKRGELEDVLIEKFGIKSDSLSQDADWNIAMENLLQKIDVEEDSNEEFTGEYGSLKDNEFLFLINLVDSLKDDGIMAVSISQNFLYKNSLQTLRKYLTHEKNYIDTIISIPEELGRRRPEVVIVFKKNRTDDDILFIDMSKQFKTQKSAKLFPGLFRRNLILANETINKMKDVFINKLTISKFSNVIKLDEIAQNDFNLSVSRYVDTFEEDFIRLDDLTVEKREIDENIENLNLKIEKMMKELDIRF